MGIATDSYNCFDIPEMILKSSLTSKDIPASEMKLSDSFICYLESFLGHYFRKYHS